MKPGLLGAVVLAASMLLASVAAVVFAPTALPGGDATMDLERLVPLQFGDWRAEAAPTALIVNPQQQRLIERIYGQTLMRTYVGPGGDRIMVSIAYGSDQSDTLQVHRPEVCYAAQGFQVLGQEAGFIAVLDGRLPVKRVVAQQGARHEPITYWIRVGDTVVAAGIQQKLAQLAYGIAGTVPDGMLVRVSMIDRDESRAYAIQERFLRQMLEYMTPAQRQRLAGRIA